MQIVGYCNHKNVNVYSYARWSSEAQGDGDSDRRQRKMAEEWCRQRGLNLTGTEKDEGVSAKAGRNYAAGSGLSRLLKLVRPGDYLLVEDNDRLSRQDWLTAMNFLAQIVAKGVKVVTLSNNNEIDAERFRNDPSCFLPAILRAHLGNAENLKKAARIRASWQARKEAVARGEKPINANLPGWLHWNPESQRVEVDEAKAAVVRRMFALYLEHGTLSHVSRTLNKEGAMRVSRRSDASGFSKDYVFRCLTNPAVIGECMGKPKLFPVIVSEADFYRVGERLKAGRHNTHTRRSASDNLFLGLATCAKCGGPLHRHSQHRNHRVYPYLVCGLTLRGRGNCGLSSIDYGRLEQAFLSLLAESGMIQQALNAGPTEPSDLVTLRGKLSALGHQGQKLLKLIEGEENPTKRLLARLQEIEHAEETLKERIHDVEREFAVQTTPAEAYEEYRREFAHRMGDPAYRIRVRASLQDFIEKISVRLGKDEAEVQLRTGRSITVILRKSGWMFCPSPRPYSKECDGVIRMGSGFAR